MSISKKTTLLLLLMLLVGIANIFVIYNYQDTQKHDAHVVNVAGRQRMLTQKMSKFVLSIAYGNDNDRNALEETVNLYSSSLESLWHGGYVMEEEIPPAPIAMDELFKKNDAIWQSFKEKTETVIKEERENPLFKDAISYVYGNSETLQKANDVVVTAYDTLDSAHEYAHEINVAGRQRMLSQKIFKNVFSVASGINVKDERDELQKSIELYEKSLLVLRDGGISVPWEREIPPPLPRVRQAIDITEKIWSEFMKRLNVIQKESRDNKEFIEAVAAVQLNNKRLLSISDEVTEDLDKIFSNKVFNLRIILMSMLGFDILIFVVGYILSFKMVRPIKELAIATKKIGSGESVDKMKITYRDEIGELGKAFNKMIDDLEDSRKEMVSAKDFTGNILASMIDSLIVVDLDGLIRTVNQATLDLLGYKEEEILGKPVGIIFKLKEKEIPEKTKIQELSEEGSIRDYKTKSGESIPMSLFTPIMRSQDGRLLGYVCVARDMRQINKLIIDIEKARSEIEEWSKTLERRVDERTEELAVAKEGLERKVKEIAESEEKYRKLMETAQDAILCAKNGIITDWNRSAEELFGYSKDEIMGKSVNIFIPEKYKKEHQGGLERFLKTGVSRMIGKTMEVSGITKEGIEIPIEISLTAQKIEEKQYLFMAIVRDLTERKKIEETLLQTEKLKAMGMMTSGVAHDFNNILAIISGHTQLLEGSYKDDKKLTDVIRTIYKASKDGAGIVRRMRQFTKMERDISGFEPVDIKGILKDAINFLKPRWMNIAIASGKPFDMDMDGIKEIPSILGNPSELRETFINIINNAMDAMSEGGRLSFRTWSGKDTAFVSIADTGEGMPEEVKKRIFDPFFTTKRAEGSGLGMSEVYGIVTGHGGKIDVSSELGKGTTFTLKFPIATETIQEKILPEPDRKITTKKLRILVIDDEKDICNILSILFSRDGHDVKAVASGKEGIDLIKSEEFDLVLSDLVMSGLSGHDVIKALNKLDKRPKVGLITGWKEEIENKNKEELNVNFIIRKPFDLSDLTKQINDLFI